MSFERDNIRRMQGYTSGEQPDEGTTIKLNTNENPYPPSPKVAEVLAGLHPEELRRYPQPTALPFRHLAAALHGVSYDQIIATRGGDELLRLVITTFVDPGEPIGVSEPTYSLYPVLAQIQNCPLVEVPLTEDWQLPGDFARQMNQAGVKLTLLVNPHAPSGALLSSHQISTVAETLDGLLLLDEAYIDFVEEQVQLADLINRHENLIVLRTLSKGYSLAGLRFGYGIGDASLIQPMITKTRDSYNLDHISQQIAAAALSDQAYASGTWQKVISERARLRHVLASIGLPSPESHANFLLATVTRGLPYTAEELYHALKERHILVRYFAGSRLADKLRISIGSEEENDQLISALTELLGQ
jgi:histidinol-phosphate aminotransferase